MKRSRTCTIGIAGALLAPCCAALVGLALTDWTASAQEATPHSFRSTHGMMMATDSGASVDSGASETGHRTVIYGDRGDSSWHARDNAVAGDVNGGVVGQPIHMTVWYSNGSGSLTSANNATITTANMPATGYGLVTSGNLIVAGGAAPARPEGAIYHQVVDKYYDKDGQVLEVASATHVVDPAYCHGGRRDQDLIASIHDDKKGNVWFGEQAPETTVAEAR